MNRSNLPYSLFLILALVIINGCGIHAPVSESMIIEDKPTKIEGFRDVIRLIERKPSVSYSIYPGNFRDLTINQHAKGVDTTLNRLWQIGISGHSILIRLRNNFSLGLNPGAIFNFGADFTYEFFDRTYFTGVVNILGSGEIIVQRKILDNDFIILSLGASYRHEQMEYRLVSLKPSRTGEAKTKPFGINLWGIRGLIAFPYLNNKDFRSIVGIYKEPNYNILVINLGTVFSF